ncbi:GNAT family N-acetyltransferase [Fulvimarina sp. 2208YS6-2-32]|uniref:GNAT family N-acetyltransferase n=1 Tax=Fulvimarina uroteuthidis TaxID=3098149 RepID=A0ABU5I8Q2_9HYPH|nr:GNAT family N-acetyltransferase [Fulvimarina sp. 2208YS6-2-32]MDY8110646.1 GNAT family N-acetyltransferase [Fulvimarina sp. 2208YS6-2-32]
MYFVRTAMERDLPAISKLLEETWHATYDAIYGAARVSELTRAFHSVDAMKPRINRPSSEFIVADNGERLGGVAFAASSDADRALVVLHQLYVLPAEQRSGIGAEMLGEIMNAFPDGRRIRCEVEPANAGAVAFYEAHGFAAISTATAMDGADDGIEVSVYERPLG